MITAGPMLRAGFNDPPVTLLMTKISIAKARPTTIGPTLAALADFETPKTIITNIAVAATSAIIAIS